MKASDSKKRSLESSDGNPSATKKRRVESDEPLWKQVKSRSFAKGTPFLPLSSIIIRF
jgi:hypothetical protein